VGFSVGWWVEGGGGGAGTNKTQQKKKKRKKNRQLLRDRAINSGIFFGLLCCFLAFRAAPETTKTN
jgi:hypothetical protein